MIGKPVSEQRRSAEVDSRSNLTWPRPRVYLLLLAAVATIALSACSSGAAPAAGGKTEGSKSQQEASQTQKVPVEGGGSYTDVSAAGLAAMLKNKNFPFINVHIPYEGEIEPTDAFIPYDQIENQLDKLPADKSARIVLYCRSGSMSATAARVLVKRGYTDVWNLDGGMIGWRQVGYPIKTR